MEYLVFSGGGINGISFVGTVHFLRKQGQWKGFAGTSVGALMALMCVLELPMNSMIVIFDDIIKSWGSADIQLRSMALVDHSNLRKTVTQPLLLAYNITDITFAELNARTKKSLKICAHNLNHMSTHLFSEEHTPNLSVVAAVVASMSVPFIFPPMEICGELFIDGGISANVPAFAFPPQKTLLVRLVGKKQFVSTAQIQESIFSYVSQIVRSVWRSSDNTMNKMIHMGYKVLDIPLLHPILPFTTDGVDLCSAVLVGALATYKLFPCSVCMLLTISQLKETKKNLSLIENGKPAIKT